MSRQTQGKLPENIRVAYDKAAMLHVLVRRCSPSETSDFTTTDIDYEVLNGFFRAKDIRAFSLAIDRLPPLYSGYGTPLAHPSSPKELAKALSEPVEAQLQSECYFDPVAMATEDAPWAFSETGRLAKAAIHEAATSYALPASKDDAFFDDSHLYVIEPLHDWLLLRNLFSIAMRIYATATTEKASDSNDLLVKTGFSQVSPTSKAAKRNMGADGYVVPVAYNPFFSRPLIDFDWDDRLIWPLLNSLVEKDKNPVERFMGFNHTRHLKGFPEVKLLTSVEADQTKASLNLKKTAVNAKDRWMYLALIPKEGEGQKETANRFLRGLDAAFGSSDISCGGDQGAENLVLSYPHNFPSALWAVIKDHPGRYLLRCKRCSKTIFAASFGGATRFCSSACRSAFNQGY